MPYKAFISYSHAADGRLGGFSAPQGLAMKRRLLAMEAAVGEPA